MSQPRFLDRHSRKQGRGPGSLLFLDMYHFSLHLTRFPSLDQTQRGHTRGVLAPSSTPHCTLLPCKQWVLPSCFPSFAKTDTHPALSGFGEPIPAQALWGEQSRTGSCPHGTCSPAGRMGTSDSHCTVSVSLKAGDLCALRAQSRQVWKGGRSCGPRQSLCAAWKSPKFLPRGASASPSLMWVCSSCLLLPSFSDILCGEAPVV